MSVSYSYPENDTEINVFFLKYLIQLIQIRWRLYVNIHFHRFCEFPFLPPAIRPSTLNGLSLQCPDVQSTFSIMLHMLIFYLLRPDGSLSHVCLVPFAVCDFFHMGNLLGFFRHWFSFSHLSINAKSVNCTVVVL